MLFPLNGNQAGLYMRLSRDEDSTRESNSIANQRKILTDFAVRNGFTAVDEYIDDGYSGTNFQRPGFSRMMEDAQNGRINAVIVKDLSRLGRDYIGIGEYMEKVFPRMGVRLISIADGYDGQDDEDPSADMMPMINFFNEFHAKQTSKKTRASKKIMSENGKFMGSKAPFGYILDPADKHHLLVDPEAAKIVKTIFKYACQGLGYKAIARRLREINAPNPTAYNNEKFPDHHKSEYWKQPHDWHPSSIKTILTNPTYLGKIVAGRRRVMSFKTKEIVTMPEDMWTVVDGMHEPIITERVWREAQKKIAVRKRVDNHGAIQMFAGLAKCADCGYAMNYTYNKGEPRFQCSQFSTKGKTYCGSHYIGYDKLCCLVLEDMRHIAQIASEMTSGSLRQLEQEAALRSEHTLEVKQRELKKLRDRLAKLDEMSSSIYEDKLCGKITENRCMKLMAKYEDEQQELRYTADTLETELRFERERLQDTLEFVHTIAAYRDISGLNQTMLNELVERIEIHTVSDAKQGIPRVSVIYKQDILMK